jgi:hypothetical protein
MMLKEELKVFRNRNKFVQMNSSIKISRSKSRSANRIEAPHSPFTSKKISKATTTHLSTFTK